MSSPKEKAEHLVNTYRIILMNKDTDCGEEVLCSLIAIKNALVCVDEITNEHGYDGRLESVKYWQEVKKEIEKL